MTIPLLRDRRPAAESMPAPKPEATCVVYYDYDTQWGLDRTRSGRSRAGEGALEFVHTERLLELHAEYSVPACFAVVGAAALSGARPYHDPAQVRRIAEAGHEVASHSFRHEWLPGLSWHSLVETLAQSRDMLEQCTGQRVVSFVPPYNQPHDFLRYLAISRSERAEVGRGRIDVARLCQALSETGYKVCRLAFYELYRRMACRILGDRWPRPAQPCRIGNVLGLRLNTPCGFDAATRRIVERAAGGSDVVVVYAHPHSLSSGGPQDQRELIAFLRLVQHLRGAGRLRTSLPRDFVA